MDCIERSFRIDEPMAGGGSVIGANRKAKGVYGTGLKAALMDYFIDLYRNNAD